MAAPTAPSTTAIASAVLQASLDAIVTTDHDQLVTEWNPAAERMFGYARSEALGQPLGPLIVPPGDRGTLGFPARDRVQFGAQQFRAQRRGGEVFPCDTHSD